MPLSVKQSMCDAFFKFSKGKTFLKQYFCAFCQKKHSFLFNLSKKIVSFLRKKHVRMLLASEVAMAVASIGVLTRRTMTKGVARYEKPCCETNQGELPINHDFLNNIKDKPR